MHLLELRMFRAPIFFFVCLQNNLVSAGDEGEGSAEKEQYSVGDVDGNLHNSTVS